MKRLQIQEVLLSEIDNNVFRIEAEFYTAQTFLSEDYVYGKDVISSAQYGTSKELNEDGEGFPVLRLNEFDRYFIGTPKKYCDLITHETFESLKLNQGDVLICRTNGNPKLVGRAAMVPKDYPFAYASYLFKVRTKCEAINPETLVAFLNSKIGRMEIEKFSMASNQVNFSPAKFREIKIPVFGSKLQDTVKELFDEAFMLQEASKVPFEQAAEIVSKYFQKIPASTNQKNTTEKCLSDSFGLTGRFDSDYFLPRHYEQEDGIRKAPSGWGTLGELCQINDKKFNPLPDSSYRYIELADITDYGDVDDVGTYSGNDLPTRARRMISSGDILVSSVEGSLKSYWFENLSTMQFAPLDFMCFVPTCSTVRLY